MHQSSPQLALSVPLLKEVCPLCFQLYAKAGEQTCLICDAASCAGCADYDDAEDGTVCFACSKP